MKKNQSMIDMTQGSPVTLLLVFSVPMLIGNLFQQLYNVVDSAIVGRFVGGRAIAAFGLRDIWWSVGIVWAMSGLAAWIRYMVVKKKYFI